MEKFQALCGRETSFGVNFGILVFEDHLHAYNTLQEREHPKKHNMSTLKCLHLAKRSVIVLSACMNREKVDFI